MTLPDRLAIMTLVIYQRHLSPHKGFCCAHRVRHGGLSCSEYARQTILDLGWRRSLAAVRVRLRACRVAALELTLEDESERKKRRRDQVLECLPDGCDIGADGCDSGCVPDSCGRLGKLSERRFP